MSSPHSYGCEYHAKLTAWDSSRVNLKDLGSDTFSFLASIVSMNWATKAARDVGTVGNVAASLNSLEKFAADPYDVKHIEGLALSAYSYFPAPIGIVASGGSVLIDISAGFYDVEPYGPPAPITICEVPQQP